MQLPEEIQNRVEAIRSDNVSGAAELAIGAAEALAALAEGVKAPSASQLVGYLESTAHALVDAQPAMAPIFNLANETLLSVEGLGDSEKIRQAASACCRDFINRLESGAEAIGKIAANLIQGDATVVAHSYSSTVLKALLLAKERGRRFDVICTESRPMREGVTLAEGLGQAGIEVRLIVDAAVFSLLPGAKIVLVGADSVSLRGLVNKIGTSGLALAASTLGIGVYTLCGSEKFLPGDHPPRPQELRDPGEVLAEAIPNVSAINYYFDLTPLKLLTGIVTEDGIIKPGALRRRLGGLQVHKSLLSGVSPAVPQDED